MRPDEEVLLTLEAPLADGRTLTLEAVGKELDEYSSGVREVRVYDGETLVQAVPAAEGIKTEWSGTDNLAGEYTSCWDTESVMTVLDLNFDGNTDFGLFGWSPNNTIPYYYWTWNGETEQYGFACTLQGVTLYPEEKTVMAEYKHDAAAYITDYFVPDENGELRMTQRLLERYDGGPNEVWMARGGAAVRPRPFGPQEGDLELVEP